MEVFKTFVVVLLAVVTTCHAFCGDGTKISHRSGDFCIRTKEPLNYYAAHAECIKDGGHLASITEVEENEYIQKYLDTLDKDGTDFWIGLTSVYSSPQSFRWTDGRKFDFHRLPQNRFAKYGLTEGRCMAMKTHSGGNWFHGNCISPQAFICKKSSRDPDLPEPPVGGYCPRGYFGLGNKCFKVVTVSEHGMSGALFSNAYDECLKATVGKNPNLAIIENAEENAEITSLLYREEGNYWIGLYKSDDNVWSWVDHSPMYYENWDGEPNPLHEYGVIHGFNFHAGKWASQPHSMTVRHGYVCQVKKDADNIINTPAPGPCQDCPEDCPDGYIPYWKGCYKVINTLSTWDIALQHCKDEGSQLAVIENEVENDAIFMIFETHPTESSEAWIGMKDSTGEGDYTWENDWPVMYTKWDVGEPSHIGRCAAMGQKGEWIAAGCESEKSFICKYTKEGPVTPPPSTGEICPSPKWKEIHGSCFYFYPKMQNWAKSVDTCKQLHPSATPAYIRNSLENQLVANELRNYKDNTADFYIGLVRDTELDEFRWFGQPDEPLAYVNWIPDGGQPGRSDNVVMITEESTRYGKWTTHSHVQNSNVICRVEKVDDFKMPPDVEGSCPSEDWVEYGDTCLLFEHDNLKTWQDANDECISKGGEDASLVTLLDYNKHRFTWFRMNDVMKDATQVDFWIGLRRDDIDSDFYWVDTKEGLDFTNWSPGQPDKFLSHFCGAVNREEAQWFDEECSETKPFVCQVVKANMACASFCKDGTKVFHKNEQFCIRTKEPLNYYAANAECVKDGGHLASITEVEENEYIQKYIDAVGKGNEDFWIGLAGGHGSSDSFRWMDGQKLEFNRLPKIKDDGATGTENKCVSMQRHSGGNWLIGNCMNPQAFICKRSRDPHIPEPPVPGYCPESYFGLGNKCYKVFTVSELGGTGKRFSDAEAECKKATVGINPGLASIENAEENAEVTSLLYREEGNYWIGMINKDECWQWTDGSPIYYTNWDGEPSSIHSVAAIHGFNYHAGKWLTQPDDFVTRHGFVCQVKKDPDNIIDDPPTGPCIDCPDYCPPGYIPYWKGCYKIVNELSTWDKALEHCRSESTELVTIQNEVENDAVFMLFQTHPAEGTEIWLGMSDSKNNGEYLWENGWPVIYTRWDVGEPSHTGRCAAMGQKGEWIAASCEFEKPYICKYTTEEPVTPSPPTGQICPSPKWKEIQGSCFYFYPKIQKWDKSVDSCKQLHPSATPAYIRNSLENQLVANELRKYKDNNADFYIGLYRENGLTEFHWFGRPMEPVGFTNWVPEGSGRSDNVVMIKAESTRYGMWTTHSHVQDSNVICRVEKVDEFKMPPDIEGSCPSEDWVEYGDTCLLFEHENLKTWSEANADCAEKGGEDATLVTLLDYNKHRFTWFQMNDIMVEGPDQVDFWMGLRRDAIDSDFYWIDTKEGLDYTNWGPGQPDTAIRHFCGAVNIEEAQWFDEDCAKLKPYACQVKKTPSVCTISTFCKEGIKVSYKNSQFCIRTKEPLNYHKANAECVKDGGHLASITEVEENEYIQKFIDVASKGGKNFWIGLTSVDSTFGSFRWLDGTALAYNRLPKTRGARAAEINNKCVSMQRHSGGNWFYGNCNTPQAFICKKSSRDPHLPEPPVPGYCPEGYFGLGNKCYKVFTVSELGGTGKRFSNAEAECKKATVGINPSLASIENAEENAEVTSLLYREEGNYWVGLNFKEGCWQWTDGSPIFYDNWDVEPNSAHTVAAIHGFNYHAGKWISQPDDFVTRHGFVCQVKKDPDNIISDPPASPCIDCPDYCPVGYIPYWKGCYKIVNQLSTWDKAWEHCQSEHTELVTIENEVENDAVFMLFQTHPAEGTEIWLGMRDSSGDGDYLWENNWPVIYTKWDIGEPSHTGRCAAMGQKGEWIAAGCEFEKPYICKYTQESPPEVPSQPKGEVCPSPKWKEILGSCFYYYPVMQNWMHSVETCKQLHPEATLAYIRNSLENKLVATELRQFKERNTANYYIGLYRDQELDEFKWYDQPDEPVEYANWIADGPGRSEYVVMLRDESTRFGQWTTHSKNQISNVICRMEKVRDYQMPTPVKGSCPTSDWVSYGDICVLFDRESRLSWQDAQDECVKQGGSGASLVLTSDYDKHRFIWSKMYEHLVEEPDQLTFWIGLRRDGVGENFYWADSKEPLDYTNWSPGQPDRALEHFCGAVNTEEAQWFDEECSKIKPFVCQVPKGSSGLMSGQVAGIVIGVLVSVALIAVIAGFVYQRRGGQFPNLPGLPTPGISFNRFDDSTVRGLPDHEVRDTVQDTAQDTVLDTVPDTVLDTVLDTAHNTVQDSEA